MPSILDTRPKGAPGRDKPVPYDRCSLHAGDPVRVGNSHGTGGNPVHYIETLNRRMPSGRNGMRICIRTGNRGSPVSDSQIETRRVLPSTYRNR